MRQRTSKSTCCCCSICFFTGSFGSPPAVDGSVRNVDFRIRTNSGRSMNLARPCVQPGLQKGFGVL